MPNELYFTGKADPQKAKFIHDDAESIRGWLSLQKPEWVLCGRLWKYVKPRTRGLPGEEGSQLAYFFAVIVETYRKEILHCLKKEEAYYHLLNEFSYEMVASKSGKPMKRLIHVNDSMPVDKMIRLIEDCQMDASINHSVFIPDPDKNWRKRK